MGATPPRIRPFAVGDATALHPARSCGLHRPPHRPYLMPPRRTRFSALKCRVVQGTAPASAVLCLARGISLRSYSALLKKLLALKGERLDAE